ncbi:MAG: hypothetical protein FJ217_16615 [Ignavibacteria bacterium]|nr:hypothetical protein [Ignavibacteria bacterium]
MSTQGGGGVFKVECSYTGAIDPDRPNLFYSKNLPCGVNLGARVSGTLSATAYTGVYTVGYRLSVPRTGGGGQFRFAIYLDSDLLKETKFPVSCPSGCTLFTEEYIPLYASFAITPSPEEISHSEFTTLTASPVWSPTPCATTVWHPEVPVTLTITGGNELGEFVEQDGTSLGQSVTRKGSQIETIGFAANGEQPRGNQGTVTIEASSRDITKTLTITVVRTAPLVDHFEVRLEPEEIAFTETSRIFVQAKDANDQDIEFDENEQLLLYLMTNPEYGTFIDVNGDTVKTSPPSLPNVRYGDAREGRIRFAAVKTNPKTQATSVIRVEWQQDATKTGEKEITILEKTLKILMQGPKEVWPLLPPATPTNPHPDNTTLLEIRLTRGGLPVSGHGFRLSTDYVDRSGGHDHDDQPNRRPRGDFENYGHFVSAQTTPNKRANPMEEKTQSNGKASYTYVASRFGDRMKLRVESLENKLLWDTLSVVERVPDLELLPDSPNYVKIGGTCNHHGPRDDSEYANCRTPDNNHWGALLTLQAIDSIAANYHREFPNDPRLRVNDISLQLGGRFDINGGWVGNGYHEFHRFGRDVDIRSSTIALDDIFDPADDLNENGQHDPGEPLKFDANDNGQYDANRTEFVNIALRKGRARDVRLEYEGVANKEHYHLYFWHWQSARSSE